MKIKLRLASLGLLLISLHSHGQSDENQEDYRLSDKPFTVEYYYKVKWGYFDEFLNLYKKNHWPFLKSGMEDGAILSAVVHQPYNHAGEASRWDLRVTITYKNALIAHGLDEFDDEAESKRLFPDQETLISEEKRRFELLEEHMDVEIREVSTSDWN